MSTDTLPFFMLRHGETDWNRTHRFQGHSEVPINATGRDQALAHAAALDRLDCDWTTWRFVASPLGRARETMEIVRTSLGLETAGYAVDRALLEVHYGDWERQTIADLRAERAQEFAAREADKWHFRPAGGQSYADIVDRVADFLNALEAPSVLVTHGGVIRATRFLYEGLDGAEAVDGPVPQDRIYRFDGRNAGWMAPSRP